MSCSRCPVRRRRRAAPVVALVLAPACVVFVLLLLLPSASASAVAAVGRPASVAAPASVGPTRARHVHPYLPPVDGPIVDHFRPPACTWCAGNRGIDYAVAPGTSARASAAGVVTFAGPGGFDLFVVVAHADGLRTTYAFLASVGVSVGDRVAQGQVVGTTGDRLHFGVRRGDDYLDPERLLAGLVVRSRLVPTDGSPARAL